MIETLTPAQVKARDYDAAMGGHTIALQVMAPGVHLGDQVTTDQFVRNFMGDVLKTRGQWAAGDLSDHVATEKVDDWADHAGTVYMGGDPHYVTIPWFAPNQLGRYLVKRYGLPCAEEDAAHALFLRLASHAMTTVDQNVTGKLEDYLAQAYLDQAAEEMVDALLGLAPAGHVPGEVLTEEAPPVVFEVTAPAARG